jgi:hypothetical protein
MSESEVQAPSRAERPLSSSQGRPGSPHSYGCGARRPRDVLVREGFAHSGKRRKEGDTWPVFYMRTGARAMLGLGQSPFHLPANGHLSTNSPEYVRVLQPMCPFVERGESAASWVVGVPARTSKRGGHGD